jgi:hypothetical protein
MSAVVNISRRLPETAGIFQQFSVENGISGEEQRKLARRTGFFV